MWIYTYIFASEVRERVITNRPVSDHNMDAIAYHEAVTAPAVRIRRQTLVQPLKRRHRQSMLSAVPLLTQTARFPRLDMSRRKLFLILQARQYARTGGFAGRWV